MGYIKYIRRSIGQTEVVSGIRQGCKGSPQLFATVVNVVINPFMPKVFMVLLRL